MSAVKKLSKEMSQTVSINYECWIVKNGDKHEIWLTDPHDESCLVLMHEGTTVEHYEPGEAIPAYDWDIDNIQGLGEIY